MAEGRERRGKINEGDELYDVHQALEFLEERGYKMSRPAFYTRVRRTGKPKSTRIGKSSTRDLRFFRRELAEFADELDEVERIKETHWTREEFAHYLGYTTNHTYQMTMRMNIPHIKAMDGKLYYDPDEVIEFLRAHSARVKAAGTKRGRPRKKIRGLEDEE